MMSENLGAGETFSRFQNFALPTTILAFGETPMYFEQKGASVWYKLR
jgi:hypothetical protein